MRATCEQPGQIHRIRRPHVAAFVALLAVFLSAACASSGRPLPRPFPVPSGSVPETEAPQAQMPVPVLVDAGALVTTALSLRGVPYRNGGATPSGFDCSGFTQYVYSRSGIALPRETRQQYQSGRSVENDIAPGDLLFFTTTGPGPTHVGIAIGGRAFVHAPSSSGVVRVERIDARYWSARYLGARRLTPAD